MVSGGAALLLQAFPNRKPEQIKAHIDELAASYEKPAEVVRWYYGDSKRMAEVEAVVIENNVAEFVLAMKHGLGLNKILGTIHTYPTMAEANKYAAGEWKRNHQPAKLLEWVAKYHAWRRA